MVFKRLGQLACTGEGLLPDDAAREFWETGALAWKICKRQNTWKYIIRARAITTTAVSMLVSAGNSQWSKSKNITQNQRPDKPCFQCSFLTRVAGSHTSTAFPGCWKKPQAKKELYMNALEAQTIQGDHKPCMCRCLCVILHLSKTMP